MIKVVSFKICPFVQRVTALLEAKEVPYEIEYISLKDKPDWFLEISPNGQVPLLITESGVALFESDAIVEYIEDEFGPLQDQLSNEDKAVQRAWSYLGTKHYLMQCGTMSSKDKATFDERASKLQLVFQKAEKQLTGDTRFFDSNTLGKVDVAWLPLLHRAAIIKEKAGYDFLCGLPKMQAWQHAVLETGFAVKSVSSDFVERFSDFYLKNTYLGEGKDVAASQCGSSSCCG
ncbi:glutathione S-transferase family protein [Grimontia sp. SpTr1]|uniref:glutathione S-transferase family protein n=1 Tax=Grimontia sp. SpTr1 TaxID=2995319 RepID=UPI00248B8C69|nr:glutathione S-transferase family protein [Grimontia sp. SpTr1]